ncbi:hypothetical protein Dsin_025949 [Dipteronia sinensis]|uniref:Zinc knuckle CX2CX4HX4C domain-containing protein n=1 Tax=Dipteronia sinensis TaxID=43782 RepID=A0AAD9ZXW1_9ROSI|nr:hypothetical protein Dsin_025949 [Dipteronia sinensis]
MNRDVGLYLRGLIGDVREIDYRENGIQLGKFVKVRVLIDIMVPLKRGLRVELEDEKDISSVMICYERMSNFYYFYDIIEHLLRECPRNDKCLMDSSKLRYGPWMRAIVMTRNKGGGGRRAGGGKGISE